MATVFTTVCRRTFDGREFLEYYTYLSKEDAQKEVDKLNEERPEKLFNGIKIDWNKTKEFFVSEQELFDTRFS